MRLSIKLILSFSVIILLLLVIGLAGQYLNEEVRNQMAVESRKAVNELQLSHDIGLELYKSIINVQFLLEDRYREEISGGDDIQRDLTTYKAPQQVNEALDNVKHKLNEYENSRKSVSIEGHNDQGSNKETLDTIKNLEAKFDIYSSLIEQLFTLTEQSYQDGKEFFSVTIEPYFRSNLLPIIERIRTATGENLEREFQYLSSRLGYTSRFLLVATIGALFLASFITYFLYRSIATPLERLSAAAKEIGKGDLSKRIDLESKDEIGELAGEFNRMIENLNKTTVSKDYVTNIIESMADALIVVDAGNRIQRVNSAALEMLGYDEKLIGSDIEKILGKSGRELFSANHAEEFEDLETHLINHEGEHIPVSMSKALMYDSGQKVKGVVCVASDITERKVAKEKISRSLKEKEMLLAEIHHRVKNNLAVISGLLQMQEWETDQEVAKKVLIDSQLRVQSIALVHEKLYQSESLSYIEFDKYVRDLLQAINSTYIDSSPDIQLDTEVENVALNINQAIPCSLIINEMVVNAYKHAFNNSEKGYINVKAWCENERVFLEVRDNGVGVPDGFNLANSNTLGMSLLDTLTKQLRGNIHVENDGGAVFTIDFKREEVF